jgi:hypothetical protein
MKYWLKQCPRCRGDLREEPDIFGERISCLQCGYTLTQEEEMRLIAERTLKPRVGPRKRAA